MKPYENICQYYDNMTQAINEALELLCTSKDGTLHKDCGKNMQNDGFCCKNNFTAFLGYNYCFLYHYLPVYSTSPTGSENHLSPSRFQTFNRKVF